MGCGLDAAAEEPHPWKSGGLRPSAMGEGEKYPHGYNNQLAGRQFVSAVALKIETGEWD
jgi:hypothetical protein